MYPFPISRNAVTVRMFILNGCRPGIFLDLLHNYEVNITSEYGQSSQEITSLCENPICLVKSSIMVTFVYQNYSFYKSLRTDQLEIPVDRQLPDLSDMSDSFLNQNSRQVKMPCIIVADDAFPLSRNCRKHYPKKKLAKKLANYLSSFNGKKNY